MSGRFSPHRMTGGLVRMRGSDWWLSAQGQRRDGGMECKAEARAHPTGGKRGGPQDDREESQPVHLGPPGSCYAVDLSNGFRVVPRESTYCIRLKIPWSLAPCGFDPHLRHHSCRRVCGGFHPRSGGIPPSVDKTQSAHYDESVNTWRQVMSDRGRAAAGPRARHHVSSFLPTPPV